MKKNCPSLAILVVTLTLFSLSSCSKRSNETTDVNSTIKSSSLGVLFFNKNGEEINVSKTKKRSTNEPGCSDYSYLTQISCYYGPQRIVGLNHDSVRITQIWNIATASEHFLPVLNSFSKGYFRLKKNGVASSWSNRPLIMYTSDEPDFPNSAYGESVLESPQYHTINDNGQMVNMRSICLSYSFTISLTDYCYYDGIDQYVRIGTDCDEIPYMQNAGYASIPFVLQNVDTKVYQHSPISAQFPNTLVLEPTSVTLYPYSNATCHLNGYAMQNEYTVRYKPQGSSIWSYAPYLIVYSSSTDIYKKILKIPSLSPGYYDVQVAGYTASVVYYDWTDWSPMFTAVVH